MKQAHLIWMLLYTSTCTRIIIAYRLHRWVTDNLCQYCCAVPLPVSISMCRPYVYQLLLTHKDTHTHTHTHQSHITFIFTEHCIFSSYFLLCCLIYSHSTCLVECQILEKTVWLCCCVCGRQVKWTSVMLLYNQHSCVGGGYEKTLEKNDTDINMFHHIHRAVTGFYDCYDTNGDTYGGGTHFMSDKRVWIHRKAAAMLSAIC